MSVQVTWCRESGLHERASSISGLSTLLRLRFQSDEARIYESRSECHIGAFSE